MKNQQQQRYRNKQLQIQFLSSCSQKDLPKQYPKFVLSLVGGRSSPNSLKQRQQILKHEIHKVETNQTMPQEISKILQSREIIVGLLRNMLLHNRNKKKDIDLDTICRYVETVRQLSLEIIQRLAKWLKFLGNGSEQSQQSRILIENNRGSAKNGKDPFTKKTLFKISSDIDFLRYSALRKYIQFSNSNDPLFLYPLRKFWSLSLISNYNSRAVINLFQISERLKTRLQRANQFLRSGLDIAQSQVERTQDQQSDNGSQENDYFDKQGQSGQQVVETKNNSIIFKVGTDQFSQISPKRKLKSLSMSPYESNVKRIAGPQQSQGGNTQRMRSQEREIVYLPNIRENRRNSQKIKGMNGNNGNNGNIGNLHNSAIEPYIKDYKKRERSKNTYSEQQKKKQRQLAILKKKFGISTHLETQYDYRTAIPGVSQNKAGLQPINPQKKWIRYQYSEQIPKYVRTDGKIINGMSYGLNQGDRIFHKEVYRDNSPEYQQKSTNLTHLVQPKIINRNTMNNARLEKLKAGEKLSKEDRIHLQRLARSRLESEMRRNELIDEQKRAIEEEKLSGVEESAIVSHQEVEAEEQSVRRNHRVIRSRIISKNSESPNKKPLFGESPERKNYVRYNYRKQSKNEGSSQHYRYIYEGASSDQLQGRNQDGYQYEEQVQSGGLKKSVNKQSNSTIKKVSNLTEKPNKKKSKSKHPMDSSENEYYHERKRIEFLNKFKKFNFKATQEQINAINNQFLERQKLLKQEKQAEILRQEKQREKYYKRKMMYQRGLKSDEDEQNNGEPEQHLHGNYASMRVNMQGRQQGQDGPESYLKGQVTQGKEISRRGLPQTKGKNLPKSRNKEHQDQSIQITDRKKYFEMSEYVRELGSRQKHQIGKSERIENQANQAYKIQDISPQRLYSGQIGKIKNQSGRSLYKKDQELLLKTVKEKEQKQVGAQSDWSMEKDQAQNRNGKKTGKQKKSVKYLKLGSKDKIDKKPNNPNPKNLSSSKNILQKLQDQHKKIEAMDKKIKKLQQKIQKEKSTKGLDKSRSIKGVEGKIIKNGSQDGSQSPQKKLRPLNADSSNSDKNTPNSSNIVSPTHYKKQSERPNQNLQQILNKNSKMLQQKQSGKHNLQASNFSQRKNTYQRQQYYQSQGTKNQSSLEKDSKNYLTVGGKNNPEGRNYIQAQRHNQKYTQKHHENDLSERQVEKLANAETKKGRAYFSQKDEIGKGNGKLLGKDVRQAHQNKNSRLSRKENQSDEQLQEADKKALKKYQQYVAYDVPSVQANRNKQKQKQKAVQFSTQTYDILRSKQLSQANSGHQSKADNDRQIKNTRGEVQQSRIDLNKTGNQQQNSKSFRKGPLQQSKDQTLKIIQQNQKIVSSKSNVRNQFKKQQGSTIKNQNQGQHPQINHQKHDNQNRKDMPSSQANQKNQTSKQNQSQQQKLKDRRLEQNHQQTLGGRANQSRSPPKVQSSQKKPGEFQSSSKNIKDYDRQNSSINQNQNSSKPQSFQKNVNGQQSSRKNPIDIQNQNQIDTNTSKKRDNTKAQDMKYGSNQESRNQFPVNKYSNEHRSESRNQINQIESRNQINQIESRNQINQIESRNQINLINQINQNQLQVNQNKKRQGDTKIDNAKLGRSQENKYQQPSANLNSNEHRSKQLNQVNAANSQYKQQKKYSQNKQEHQQEPKVLQNINKISSYNDSAQISDKKQEYRNQSRKINGNPNDSIKVEQKIKQKQLQQQKLNKNEVNGVKNEYENQTQMQFQKQEIISQSKTKKQLRNLSQVQEHRNQSQVQGHRNQSQVQGHRNQSQAQQHKNQSQVQQHKNQSQVQQHKNQFQVQQNKYQSQVQHHKNQSQVRELRNQSRAQEHRNQSEVQGHRNQSQVQHHKNQSQVREHKNQSRAQEHRNQFQVQQQKYQSQVQQHKNQSQVQEHRNQFQVQQHKNQAQIQEHKNQAHTQQQQQKQKKKQGQLTIDPQYKSQINSFLVNNTPVSNISNNSKSKASIVFKSVSFNERQLIDYIEKIIPKSKEYMNRYLNTDYFEKRQIATTICNYGQDIVSVALTHNKFTDDGERNLYIIFFKLTNEKYKKSEAKILSSFIKYLFTNDPVDTITFLVNKNYGEGLVSMLQQTPCFQGKIKQPLEISDYLVSQTAILLKREESVKCKFEEEYSSILNTQVIFATKNQQLEKTEGGVQKSLERYRVMVSDSFRLTMQNAVKTQKGTKRFGSLQQLNQHLEQEQLIEFSHQDLGVSENSPIISGQFLYYQDFRNLKFSFVTNIMYLSIDPSIQDDNILYRQFDEIFIILLKSNQNGIYYMFLDNLYDDATNDAVQFYLQNVEGRNIKEIFNPTLTSNKSTNNGKKLVTIPKFQKQVIFPVDRAGQIKCNFSMSLNWKQYVRGVRTIDERQISADMISPFNVGLIRLNPSGNLKYLFIAQIDEDDENQEV